MIIFNKFLEFIKFFQSLDPLLKRFIKKEKVVSGNTTHEVSIETKDIKIHILM